MNQDKLIEDNKETIKLKLDKEYKSLKPFEKELPLFTILTGINGAGKTQILSALVENRMELIVNKEKIQNKTFVTHSSLIPNNGGTTRKTDTFSNIENTWNEYSRFKLQHDKNPNIKLENAIPAKTYQKLIRNISNFSNKPLEKLDKNDFYDYYPLEDGIATTNVFYQNLSMIFKRYHSKYMDNKFNRFLATEENNKNIKFLTDEKFNDIYGGKPWELINEIFEQSHLNYYVTSPENDHPETPFTLKLKNKLNNATIDFNDLSSGEKVLMSLALALYNSKNDLEFPKILLMDEPDASLHPSMAKQFLNVIENVFVKDKGVKVIMTTHSPSTVALAPEEALFIVNKTDDKIEKVSKDKALRILTSGVPSLSINYENRRQIFVESKYDVKYYEKLYEKLMNNLNSEISLHFISSGDSRIDQNGNRVATCSQVKNVTNKLRELGNNQVWGIIDYDLNNNSDTFVKVVGKGNRYSIENYILDPLLIGVLLLREKKICREEIGVKNNENYYDIRKFGSERLQIIVDYVINKLGMNIDSNCIECKLINEKIIKIPKMYLDKQGHELEKLILERFQGLNELKKNKEERLKIEMIDKVIDEMPGMLSIDILNLFKEVQSQ